MVESSAFVTVRQNKAEWFDLIFRLPSGREEVYRSVFLLRRDAEEFAERVNRLGLSAMHIGDVLEDALP